MAISASARVPRRAGMAKGKAASMRYNEYQLARYRLGAETEGMPNHSLHRRLSDRTTFRWMHSTWQLNIRWVWSQYKNYRGTDSRQSVMLGLIGRAFGITRDDLRFDIRDVAISMPRMIGIAMLREDGVTYYKIRACWNKDYKSIAYCCEQMREHVRWLHDTTIDHGGPASVDQSPGSVSVPVPAQTGEDMQADEAGSSSDRG